MTAAPARSAAPTGSDSSLMPGLFQEAGTPGIRRRRDVSFIVLLPESLSRRQVRPKPGAAGEIACILRVIGRSLREHTVTVAGHHVAEMITTDPRTPKDPPGTRIKSRTRENADGGPYGHPIAPARHHDDPAPRPRPGRLRGVVAALRRTFRLGLKTQTDTSQVSQRSLAYAGRCRSHIRLGDDVRTMGPS